MFHHVNISKDILRMTIRHLNILLLGPIY